MGGRYTTLSSNVVYHTALVAGQVRSVRAPDNHQSSRPCNAPIPATSANERGVSEVGAFIRYLCSQNGLWTPPGRPGGQNITTDAVSTSQQRDGLTGDDAGFVDRHHQYGRAALRQGDIGFGTHARPVGFNVQLNSRPLQPVGDATPDLR